MNDYAIQETLKEKLNKMKEIVILLFNLPADLKLHILSFGTLKIEIKIRKCFLMATHMFDIETSIWDGVKTEHSCYSYHLCKIIGNIVWGRLTEHNIYILFKNVDLKLPYIKFKGTLDNKILKPLLNYGFLKKLKMSVATPKVRNKSPEEDYENLQDMVKIIDNVSRKGVLEIHFGDLIHDMSHEMTNEISKDEVRKLKNEINEALKKKKKSLDKKSIEIIKKKMDLCKNQMRDLTLFIIYDEFDKFLDSQTPKIKGKKDTPFIQYGKGKLKSVCVSKEFSHAVLYETDKGNKIYYHFRKFVTSYGNNNNTLKDFTSLIFFGKDMNMTRKPKKLKLFFIDCFNGRYRLSREFWVMTRLSDKYDKPRKPAEFKGKCFNFDTK